MEQETVSKGAAFFIFKKTGRFIHICAVKLLVLKSASKKGALLSKMVCQKITK